MDEKPKTEPGIKDTPTVEDDPGMSRAASSADPALLEGGASEATEDQTDDRKPQE
jgi:hypothetical protein